MVAFRVGRRGFTLVELLVVIAIIGILVGLLLPAVQSARESARRLQCENNLKQLALACLAYNAARKSLPPASQFPAGSNPDTQNNANLGPSWVVCVLPYLEQENLYNIYQRNVSMCAAANEPFRSTELAVMKCPSDIYNRTKYSGRPSSSQNSNHGANWARGNYGANGALGFHSPTAHCGDYGTGGAGCAGGATSGGWRDSRTRGVMGLNVACTSADIRDGMSNTILLEEIRAGLTSFDPRGTWAFPGAGCSSVWAHGYIGDSGGPNTRQQNADDTTACNEVEEALGGSVEVARLGMGCYGGTGSHPNRQAAPRSMHSGGIFVAFCDGSVRMITDYVEISTNINYASVWDRLNTSKDNLPIPAGSY